MCYSCRILWPLYDIKLSQIIFIHFNFFLVLYINRLVSKSSLQIMKSITFFTSPNFKNVYFLYIWQNVWNLKNSSYSVSCVYLNIIHINVKKKSVVFLQSLLIWHTYKLWILRKVPKQDSPQPSAFISCENMP